jgi:hypothetical protein
VQFEIKLYSIQQHSIQIMIDKNSKTVYSAKTPLWYFAISAKLMVTAFLFVFSMACKNEVTQKQEQQSTPVATRPDLVTENFTDSMDMPHSHIFFTNGILREKIATTTGNFNPMSAEEKAQAEMPASYIVAGSAFWAGLRQIVVIDSTAAGYIVRTQFQDSEAEGVEPFTVIKSFPK